MRRIVVADWQTDGQWIDLDAEPPYPKEPPEDFVREVMKKCVFHKIDLDRDGRAEIIVDLSYSPGAKGDRSFYVLRRQRDNWAIIGRMNGNVYQIDFTREGYGDIKTTEYLGGHRYATIWHRYRNGQYKEWQRETWTPEPDEKTGESPRR